MEIDKLQLLMGEPINIQDLGKVYQPTIQDLLIMGTDNYEKLLIPFSMDIDNFEFKENINIMNFDLFFYLDLYNNDKNVDKINILDLLKESLEFYTKEKIVIDKQQGLIFIGDKGILHRLNYDSLAEVIFKINCRTKPKVEKPPIFKNERQRDIYNKIQMGRQRQQKENSLGLYDIINFTIDDYINAKKWTIFQLMTKYEVKMNKESYQNNFEIALVGGSEKLDMTHWTIKSKL